MCRKQNRASNTVSTDDDFITSVTKLITWQCQIPSDAKVSDLGTLNVAYLKGRQCAAFTLLDGEQKKLSAHVHNMYWKVASEVMCNRLPPISLRYQDGEVSTQHQFMCRVTKGKHDFISRGKKSPWSIVSTGARVLFPALGEVARSP